MKSTVNVVNSAVQSRKQVEKVSYLGWVGWLSDVEPHEEAWGKGSLIGGWKDEGLSPHWRPLLT